MLTRLVLRDFQKWGKLDVRFGRITTLVGPSDSGKSAVLRAVRLVCRNLPAGVAAVRHGRTRLLAKLVVDGKAVTRVKGKAENAYLLDAEEFKALGQGPQGIPRAIAEVLKTDDINFHLQHDPPFWFTDPPGQVSKNLNRIVNLDVIDRVLAKAHQNVRKADAVAEVTADRVKEAEAAVKKLAWVEEFDRQLQGVIVADAKVREYDGRIARLESLLDQYDRATADRKRLKKVADRGATVAAAGAKAAILDERFCRLTILLRGYLLSARDARRPISGWDGVEECRAEADNTADECARLERLVEALTAAEEKVCQLRVEEKELLKHLGSRCPQCGTVLKSSASSRRTCTSAKHRR